MSAELISESCGKPPEHSVAGEYNWYYRPLDGQDKYWMQQLGCDWPLEDEDTWLAELNDLVAVGQEKQGPHPDAQKSVVYQAREYFFTHIPLVMAAQGRLQQYRTDSMILRLPPSGNFVSGQRALAGNGVHVGKFVAIDPAAIQYNADTVMERLQNLIAHGIDTRKLLSRPGELRWLRYDADSTTLRLNTLYSFARLWGIKDPAKEINRYLEIYSDGLSRSLSTILSLGRMCTVLFSDWRPQKFPIREAHQITSAPIIPMIAAYLSRGRIISSPQGLTYQARRLDEAYSRDQLLGYVARHGDDPVVRVYLKGHPLTDEELGNLPDYDELPQPDRYDGRDSRLVDPADRRALERAASTRQLAHSARRMDGDFKRKERDDLLDLIAGGLEVEAAAKGHSLHAAQKEAYERGKAARRELAAPYIGRVISAVLPHVEDWPDDALDHHADRLQMEFVKLMMAIVDLAHRHPEDRPDSTWEFLEEQMGRYRLSAAGLAGDDEENGSLNKPVFSAG